MRPLIAILSVLLALAGPLTLVAPALAATSTAVTNPAATNPADDVHFDAPSPPGPAETAERDRSAPRHEPSSSTPSGARALPWSPTLAGRPDTTAAAARSRMTPRFITHCALLC